MNRNRYSKKALEAGFRSGLEMNIAEQLKKSRVKYSYEEMKIKWTLTEHKVYTPDFVLPNGIIIEGKGRFKASDRKKHLAIKKQHPELDIRFVFSNSNNKILKGSKTTYAMWCEKNGFLYADRLIPKEWLDE